MELEAVFAFFFSFFFFFDPYCQVADATPVIPLIPRGEMFLYRAAQYMFSASTLQCVHVQ